MEPKYTAIVQGMVLLCFLLHGIHQRICVIKKAEGSSDFRKLDIGISLPVGIPSVMCSPAGMTLPLFYNTELCDAIIQDVRKSTSFK